MAALSEHRLGLILVAISTLAWSTAGLFTRAIHQDLMTVIVWRGLAGALGLALLLLARQGWGGLRDFGRLGWPGWLFVGLACTITWAYVAALRGTSIAHVAIIYAVAPFLTAGLAWVILGSRPDRVSVIASLTAFAGAVVMVGLGHDGTLSGDGLALLMTAATALMTVIARRYRAIPTLPAGIAAAVLSVLIALPFVEHALPPVDQMVLMAGFGLVNSTLAFALFLMGSRRIAPIETALLGALEAPITPLWVWLVFDETPGLPTVLGGAVILAAVFWHVSRQFRAG